MLVLNRKEGEALEIDGDIRIVVRELNGGQVKIGIEAPPDVNVVREELVDTPRDSGGR